MSNRSKKGFVAGEAEVVRPAVSFPSSSSGALATKPKLLTDEWAAQHAYIFIQDYVTICRGHCASNWRAQGSPPTTDKPSSEVKEVAQAKVAAADVFVFDSSKAFPDAAKDQEQLQNEMNQVLFFFLRDVLGEDVLARVVDLLNGARKPKEITWDVVLAVIYANQPKANAIELLAEFVTKRRGTGVNIKAWFTTLSLLKLALVEEQVTIPASTYIKAFEQQITRAEDQVLADYSNFDELKAAVDAVSLADLPAFDSKFVATAANLPSVNGRPSREFAPTSEGKFGTMATRPDKVKVAC